MSDKTGPGRYGFDDREKLETQLFESPILRAVIGTNLSKVNTNRHKLTFLCRILHISSLGAALSTHKPNTRLLRLTALARKQSGTPIDRSRKSALARVIGGHYLPDGNMLLC